MRRLRNQAVKTIVISLLMIILFSQIVSGVWAWYIERPGYDLFINERTDNAQTDGLASVGLGVGISHYVESAYNGSDSVQLNLTMTANSRRGITYNYRSVDYWWISANDLVHRTDRVGAGDDEIIGDHIPQDNTFSFRFYGGLGSAEYRAVYISTNGFVRFDNARESNPSPSNIPSGAEPNAFIAAIWTDLDVDASGSIITGLWNNGAAGLANHWYYVIIWNNVRHKASGQRLTFSIILEDAPQYYPANERYSQSRIWISYNAVNSINTDFSYGIEDQQGAKGLGGLFSGSMLASLNGQTLHFYQSSNSFFLKKLNLSFQDEQYNTRINIEEGYNLRGYNVRQDYTQPSEPDSWYTAGLAVAGTAVLLIGVFAGPGTLVAGAGILLDTTLVGLDWIDALALHQYSGRQVEVNDRDDGLMQQASATAYTYDYAVDAQLTLIVYWILGTTNWSLHSLTITASLEYYEYSIIDASITNRAVQTSVNLRTGGDSNNYPWMAQPIGAGLYYNNLYIGLYDESDFYKIYVNKDYTIGVLAWSTHTPPRTRFYIYLKDPNGNIKNSTGDGDNLLLTYHADSSGNWTIEIRKSLDYYGYYSMYTSLNAPPSSGGGGGGGGGHYYRK